MQPSPEPQVPPSQGHVVQFYDDEDGLLAAVFRFLRDGVAAGQPLVLIATEPRRDRLLALLAGDLDVERALATRQLTLLDAPTMLGEILVDGVPSLERFDARLDGVLHAIHAAHGQGPIRIYGEMVDLAWRGGNARAALRIEELWNELARRHAFALLCAYSMGNFYKGLGTEGLAAVAAAHAHVLPDPPDPARTEDPDGEPLRARIHSLERELAQRAAVEAALRATLADHESEREQRESLYRIHRLLHAELELDKVVQRLTDEATTVCRAEFGAFFYNVVGEDGEAYMLYTLAGASHEKFAGFPMPRNTQVFAPTFHGDGVVRLDDVTADRRYGQNPPYYGMPKGHLPVKSYLAVPVISRAGEVIGGLFFGHSKPGVFTARDEALIAAAAPQAATAIENARLYESEKRARAIAEVTQRRTATLHAMAAGLSRAISPDEAARIVIRELRQLLDVDGGGVVLLDGAGAQIERLILEHDDPNPPAYRIELADNTPICVAARTGELVWTVGIAALEARYPELVARRSELQSQTWGAFPILFEGRTLGAIAVRSKTERPLTVDEHALLLAVGRQVGQAIERARLHEATIAARSEAEQASRAKDDFLAMLGHELRNPLSPILTAVQLMKLRGEHSSGREQRIIERQVNHLIRLVDDLLDISRITRGKVQLDRKPITLAGLVAKAVEIASPLFEERHHRLEIALPREELWLEADEIRMCQVFANLLTNAAKYTPAGGEIAVRAERDRAEIVIRVRDNGVGIAPELLPRVFDLFVQGMRSVDRSQGGLGIGLALVRNLVAMHGGMVSAHSDGPGRGSEIVLRLPSLDRARVPGTPGTSALAGSDPAFDERVQMTPRRILIVDDNQDAAALLGEMLRSVGHDVVVVYDGPSALDAVSRFTPSVAILDIGLPVMDGYELAGALRAQLGDAIRLMAVTGYGQTQDRVRAQNAGFDDHFVKPVALDTLLTAIEQPSGALRAPD